MLIVLDHQLRDFYGHYYQYDQTLVRFLSGLGYPVRLLCHEQAQAAVVNSLRAEAVLSGNATVPARLNSASIRSIRLVWLAIAFARNALRDAFAIRRRVRKLSAGTIYIPSLSIGMAIAAVLSSVCSSSVRRWRWVLCLRDWTSNETTAHRYILNCIRLLGAMLSSGSVIIASDSTRVLDHLRPQVSAPLVRIPIPHASPPTTCAATLNLRPMAGFKILYLGGGRMEQGIVTLVAALLLLRGEFEAQAMCAVLQRNTPDSDTTAHEAWRQLDGVLENIQFVDGHLEEEVYWQLLKWADLLVLPYDRAAYVWRTSGVVIEALAAGTPVLVPSETWMADEVSLGGGLVFHSGSDGVARAILDARERHTVLKRDADCRSRCIRAEHNVENLVGRLLPDLADYQSAT